MGFKDIPLTMYGIMSDLLDWNYGPDERGEQVRVLAINGNDDWIVNTPGQMMVYDKLSWKGQAAYRVAPWQHWSSNDARKSDKPSPFAGSGFWKQSSDRRVVLAGVDGAGHEVPKFQAKASLDLVSRWLEGWNL